MKRAARCTGLPDAKSGEARVALRRELQRIVDCYREADVAAAVERRRAREAAKEETEGVPGSEPGLMDAPFTEAADSKPPQRYVQPKLMTSRTWFITSYC